MFVYADHAATTPLTEKARNAMLPALDGLYGNPSSLHKKGREAEAALAQARAEVAACIGADARELYFTSGGSESDNWAITEAARIGAKQGKKHLITSAFEHHAVLHTMKRLEQQGFLVTYLDVSENGVLEASAVAAAIRPDTALVSVMYANNEIGTIQPVAEIAALCHERGVLFHTDAVQAVGHLPIDVHREQIDFLSCSAHKFGGPKGVGALYVRRGIPLKNLIEGGAQEFNRRGGTENLPGILGMAAALKESCAHMEAETERLTKLRDRLIRELTKLPKTQLNGDAQRRMPGNVNLCFHGIEGESMLLRLDLAGIAASSGSACTSGSLDPSHVLLAIGVPKEVAHGSLRLSLGAGNAEADVDYILEKLPPVVETLRAMSPVWEQMEQAELGT